MVKTPIVKTLDCALGRIDVHAATFAQAIRFSNAVSADDADAQIAAASDIINNCADCQFPVDGDPADFLPSAIAAQILQAANAGDLGKP